MNNQKTVNTKNYFDIITTGLGYINDVRIVDPKNFGGKGAPYLALRIAGLQGEENEVKYIRYNVNVVGSAAIDIIQQEILPALQQATENGRDADEVKFIASFSLGDVEPKLFHYKTGEKKGEPGVTLQGRLLAIKYLKRDDQVIDLSSYNDGDKSHDKATGYSTDAPSGGNSSS